MIHSSSTQWKHRFTLEIYLEDGYVIVDGQPSTSRSFRDEWLIESRRGLRVRGRQPAGAGDVLQHRPVVGARAGRVRRLHPQRSTGAQRHLRETPSRRCAWCTASTRPTSPSRLAAPTLMPGA